MSFLKKALGAFVEFDERTAPTAPLKSAGPLGPVSADGRPLAHVPVTPLSTADVEKFAQHFDELFEKANLPGPDYYEFSKAVEAMEADIPDERARMKAAFVALKVQGMSKDLLLDTAKQYIAVVDADRAALESEVAAKTKAEIEPLQNEVLAAEASVKQDEALIRELTVGLDAKRKAAQDAEAALAAAKQRLGANIEAYQTACAAMVQRINTDIHNITNTL